MVRTRWPFVIAVTVCSLVSFGVTAGAASSSKVPPIDPMKAPLPVEAGLITPTVGWIVNGLGLYITTDDAHTWKTVTPPAIVGDDAVGRMQQFVALDPTHWWMTVGGIGLPGGRCVTGSCLGSAIESTTDGGQRWRLSYLAGCLSCNTAVSFLSADQGFAVGLVTHNDLSSEAHTYSTDDGGRSWSATSTFTIPFGAGSNSVVFTSTSDGWLNASDLATDGLYRTTDGGHRWTRTPVLASSSDEKILQLDGPVFFGRARGVLGAAVEDTQTRLDHDVIYTTSNGGTNWSVIGAPDVVANSSFHSDAYLNVSIASQTTWYAVAGARLYVTHDAGQRWSWSIPSARWSRGSFQVDSVDFISPETGWVNVFFNSCGGLPRQIQTHSGRCQNDDGLAATSSGGHSWTLISKSTS